MARRGPRPPWWLFFAAAGYVGYFGLLVYSDIVRPEHRGITAGFSGGRMRVQSVAEASPADKAGLRVGDVIRSWDGQPIHVRRDWVAVEANAGLGANIRLEIEREGQPLEILMETPRARWRNLSWAGFSLAIARLTQGLTLGLGLFVAFRRPRSLVALLGGWLLASAGVYMVVLPYRFAALWRALPAPVEALFWFPYMSSLLLMSQLATLFMIFPARPGRPATPTSLMVTWIPAAAAAAGGPACHMWQAVYRPEASTGFGDRGLPLAVISLVLAVAATAILWRNYRTSSDTTDRRRMLILLAGTVIGCGSGFAVTIVYWYITPDLELLASPLSMALTLGLLAVPASFAYAILRHRLFGVRVMVRQSLRYAAARGLLLSLAPVSVALGLADVMAHRAQSVEAILASRIWVYLLLGSAALVAHRERQRWLDALDKRFFKERYDASRLLRQVADDLRVWSGAGMIGRGLVTQIERALHPEFVSLLVAEPGERRFTNVAAEGNVEFLHLPANGAAVNLLKVLGKPMEVSLAEGDWLAAQLPPDEVAKLRRSRVEMLVPVAMDPGRRQALIALGVKRSEEPYSADDRQLLAAIAASLASLLDRVAAPLGTTAVAAGHPAPGPAGVECPVCGTCTRAGETSCPDDGAELRPMTAPLVIGERYRLERRLGRGGMGTVYRARDESLGRRVAVKVLRSDLPGSRELATRFKQEAQVAATFAHQNVVTVHDFGTIGEEGGYIVMELLEGATLRAELARRGSFDPASTLAILHGVAAAVAAAHRRHIVHRDLKPENIFLVAPSQPEQRWMAKVLDFGIAKMLAPGEAFTAVETRGGVLVGTLPYMSPEQLRGEEASPSWDIWALAVIAFEMLSGRHPFAGVLVGSNRAGEPSRPALAAAPSAEAFFARALSLDPAPRPRTAQEFFGGLEEALRTKGPRCED
ncbi:MAG: protein kinase [Vicinamibacterales bacterium]